MEDTVLTVYQVRGSMKEVTLPCWADHTLPLLTGRGTTVLEIPHLSNQLRLVVSGCLWTPRFGHLVEQCQSSALSRNWCGCSEQRASRGVGTIWLEGIRNVLTPQTKRICLERSCHRGTQPDMDSWWHIWSYRCSHFTHWAKTKQSNNNKTLISYKSVWIFCHLQLN